MSMCVCVGWGTEEGECRPDIIEQLLCTTNGPELFSYMTLLNPNRKRGKGGSPIQQSDPKAQVLGVPGWGGAFRSILGLGVWDGRGA